MIGRRAMRRRQDWFTRMEEQSKPYRGKHERHPVRKWILGAFAGWFAVFTFGLMLMEGLI